MPAEPRSPMKIEGAWLRVARALWFLVTLTTATVFVVALPTRLNVLQTDPVYTDFITPGASIGITLPAFAAYITGIEVAFGLAYFILGLLLFWNKSGDWMVILYTGTLVASSVFFGDFAMSLRDQSPFWRTPITLMRVMTYSMVIIIHFLFPNGRFYPRWTRFVAPVWAAFTLSWIVFPQLIPPSNHISIQTQLDLLMLLVLTLGFGCAVVAQISRLQRVTDPMERQQTKWVVFGFAMTAAGLFLSFLPAMLFPPLRLPGPPSMIYVMIAVLIYFGAISMTPFSLAFSILRYRLWDIDLIINRALVYTALTGTLALVYLVSVLGSQQLIQALTPEDGSSLATVLSTLVIAALFNPLRCRSQTTHGRSWWWTPGGGSRGPGRLIGRSRRPEDELAVANFSAAVHEQVDLEGISHS